jgi:hypothetical protein
MSLPVAPLRPYSRFADNGIDWLLIGCLWMLAAAAMLYSTHDAIATLALGDPDNALRLVQVRDLMAGQSWYDLTQYRINPAGGGGQLHWSRFIDVQIVALVKLFGLFLSPVEAERWALVVYPLLLLLLLLVLFRRILARLGDRAFVRAGLIVAATTYSFLHYFFPLRIDHHNWQIVMSLVMLWLALGPATFVRGLVAAFAIAIHVEISLEGLPYLLIFGGLFAFDWLRDPSSAPRLRGFAAGLAIIPLAWVLLLRGPDGAFGVYCDSFSRPYLAGTAVIGASLALAMGHRRMTGALLAKLALLAIAGSFAVAVFAWQGTACLAGPFSSLDPFVREHWYEEINEGHAIWIQQPSVIAGFTMPSLLGLAVIIWVARNRAASPEGRNWQRLALVAAGGILLSLLVLRTTAVAHAYVVPAYAYVMLAVFRWGRRQGNALARIPATAACIVAMPVSVSAASVAIAQRFVADAPSSQTADCLTPEAAARLRQLPAATIFAPIDISPAILVATPHQVVATGHHRNHQAIGDLLRAFMGSAAVAETKVRASGATYVALCRNMAEHEIYLMKNPAGFTAALNRDAPPAWLQPLPAQSTGPLRVYRVLPATRPA